MLPNPYYTHDNNPICPIPEALIEIIYKRDNFLKKILEDSSSCEDSLRLLRFLIWENPDVTSIIFNEIAGLVSIGSITFYERYSRLFLAVGLLFM